MAERFISAVQGARPPPSTPVPLLPPRGGIPFPYDNSGRAYTLRELEEWQRADWQSRQEYRRRQSGGGSLHVRAPPRRG
jgi:hypothetical protein